MADRPPPGDDDPFEWEDAPARPRRRRDRDDDETFNTGERDSFSRERDFGFPEEEEKEELPRPGDPYEPSRSWLPTPSETEERDLDTGERDVGTGERDVGTGEREFGTGEREAGTGERDAGTDERERDAGDSEKWTPPKPPPRPGDPYQPPAEAYEAVESDPYDTGEGRYPTGEQDLLDTGERRRPRDRTRQRRPRRAPVGGPLGSLLERHRELPAKVRRRQAIGAGAVVLLLIIGVIALASGGDDGGGAEATPLKKLAGQSIIAPVGERGVDKRIVKQARKGQIGGVILIGDLQPDDVQKDLQKLRKAAREGDNPTLLVMVDQEGGFVKRLPGPPDIAPNDLGEGGDPTAAKAEGQKTAQFLKPIGVNVDLAPVMDVNIPQTADTIKTRTFGDDPAVVSELGVAFIQGLQEGGVSATAKHFPGLGLSTVNTDFRRVDIAASAADQQAALEPFQAAVERRRRPGDDVERHLSGHRRREPRLALTGGRPAAARPARLRGPDHHRRPRGSRDPGRDVARGGGRHGPQRR